MPKMIFAVKDTHSDSAGRRRAERMLKSGGIHIFFIEWPTPVDREDIRGSFKGVANDAEPSLSELARVAFDLGIDVVSCDLTAEETLKRLDVLNPAYAPHLLPSAFQAWGKGVRDTHAAAVIAKYMWRHPNPNCRGLVMFGADHFKDEDGRGTLPLQKLIKAASTFDCFIVNNDSVDVSYPKE